MEDTEHLTKHQRLLLKKEKREQEKEEWRLKGQRKKRNKMLMQAGILIIVLVGIGYFFMQSNPIPTYNQDPRGAPLMKIMPASYNFGDVSVAKGAVSATMDILNEGKGNLVIRSIKSSCMCTTATLIKDGAESPVFGMHSSPSNWLQIIGPNDAAQLKIYYDPAAHRELRGPVTRVITIYSNNPSNSQNEVRINVNQVA